MKYVLNIVALVFLLSGVSYGQEGTCFEELSFEEALKKSAAVGKPLFIDCYTKTCGPCKYMLDKIFPLKESGDYFNSHYICIKKDMEEGDGLEIARKYIIQVYPTYLILEADGTEFCRILGGVSKPEDDFVGKVKDAVYLAGLRKRYAAGERDREFLAEYMALLKEKDKKELQQLLTEIMLPMTTEELCLPQHWKLIRDEIHGVENPLFRRLFDERKRFASVLGKREVYAKLIYDYTEEFRLMKKMGLDFEMRMADVRQLERENYPELKMLRYAMLARQVIDKKDTGRVRELLRAVKKELPAWEKEKTRLFVLSEMDGIEKMLTVKERTQFIKSLKKLEKQAADQALRNMLQRLIQRTKVEGQAWG